MKAKTRKRRGCLHLSPKAASRLRLGLLIGSSGWVILVFVTLVYVTTTEEDWDSNVLVPSPYKVQKVHSSVVVVADEVSSTKTTRSSQLPLEIFVQEHVDQSWRINSSSLPRRLDLDPSLKRQRTIDCHEPYRSIPLLLDIDKDPFLPWIHDYFVNEDNSRVHFVAQNKRRCHTGRGRKDVMAFWEPQMALFQPISISVDLPTHRYYLAEPEHAHYPETRFICRFHSYDGTTITTLSEYPFNYEYLNWRKRVKKPMFVKDGPDVEIFDYSTLLFSCPIPRKLRDNDNSQHQGLYLDLAPIRTPARYDEGYLLTEQQVGAAEFAKLRRFDTILHYGNHSLLPRITEMGRIANLPVCTNKETTMTQIPRHEIVGCVWVAASYARRGGRSSVSDTPQRMREWLAFHQLAGYSHIYVYDNTQVDDGDDASLYPLKNVTDLFPGFVTWIRWPGKRHFRSIAGSAETHAIFLTIFHV